MKKFVLLIGIFGSSLFLYSQSSTFEAVYNIVQNNCASCHISGHESGLVLNGTISEVYDNLYDMTAHNPAAAAANKKIVFPGDPYKSFFFSKINNGLAIDVTLKAGEGTSCPKDTFTIENKEIEMVRQWIIYGAFETGEYVDEELIATFYEVGGIQSVPSPPAAPAVEEGFQIHYGPYFLKPEDEHEYWSKFSTELTEDIEVKKLDVVMGDYSHHYIIEKYDAPTHYLNPFGLRTEDPEFLGVTLVTANQYSDVLELPEKTAFSWGTDTWLDLNSHYINYSSEFPIACEVYINVYTQPAGIALYEMHADLPANYDIYIPNDNTPHTFEQTIRDPGNNDEIFIWGLTSHTHKYGDDYDVYMRTPDGDRGEKIFDASCGATNGIPGCVDEIYDYQHPPIRYWDTFLPVVADDGIIHEATFINDGDEPVSFGMTSDDEMMLIIYFYIDDTTGLNLPVAAALENTPVEDFTIDVFPNPAQDVFYAGIDGLENTPLSVELIDLTGKITFSDTYEMISVSPAVIKLERNGLPSGIYMIKIADTKGNSVSRKILFQ
ncbi:MAG: T9SS type A sorting domain-containing protein [Chitinophagales bacterium]|nr:T9SS type A sorting domain-containing protein [Chitinophagales bacterium]